MITKVILSESEERVSQVFLKDYNRIENLTLNTNLHGVDYNYHIKELKERFKDEPDDLILLAVKWKLPEKNQYPVNDSHPLKNTLTKLKEVKDYLQNNCLGEIHLSNLPQFFWEELGECINDMENYVNPEVPWKAFKELHDNVWGFRVLNPKTF